MINIQKIKSDNILFTLYKVSTLFLFLKTFYFKFFWNIPISLFLIFNITTYILYSLFDGKLKFLPPIQFLLISSIIVLQILSNNYEGLVGQIINIVCITLFLTVPDIRKTEIFKFIVKFYTLILLISLIGWILICIVKIPFPMHISEYQHYKFYDYGFVNIRIEGVIFSRYLGMFLEPGYTGVMTVLILIANGFDLHKKENLILFVATLFTLSLAAYLLLAIYVFLMVPFSKISRRVMIIGCVILVFLFLYAVNNQESIIWTYLFSRVENMLNGNITGNRFSDKFEMFYTNNIKNNTKNYLFGVGSEYFNTLKMNSCGSKVYVAQFGIINTVFVIIFYLINNLRNLSKRNLVLFIVWCASFVDIAYPTWLSFLIIYLSGAINLKGEEQNDRYITLNI